jgi:uncharacterized Zn finger protein
VKASRGGLATAFILFLSSFCAFTSMAAYTFADLITQTSLREYAGGSIYPRGVAYWEDGMVQDFETTATRITAQVYGTSFYHVELWIDDGLGSDCDCMSFVEGDFCKHCVAVGLTWLETNKTQPSTKQDHQQRKKTSPTTNVTVQKVMPEADVILSDLSHALKIQDRETLVDLIFKQAKQDPQWRARLLEKFRDQGIIPDRSSQLASPTPSISRFFSRTAAPPQGPAVLWTAFMARPSLRAYQQLKQAASEVSTWSEWKEKAIAHLIERSDQIDQQMSRSGRSFGIEPGREVSMLVDCLLWEGDGKRAFQEAKKGSCASYTWLKIAEDLRVSQPEDALSIYMMSITSVMQESNNAAYQETYRLLGIIQSLMLKLELKSQFQRYIISLETIYSGRRSFKAGLAKFK